MKNPTLPPQQHSWSNYGFHYLMAVIYICNISVAGEYENGICIVTFVLMHGRKKKSLTTGFSVVHNDYF